jgi:hypothetical protein
MTPRPQEQQPTGSIQPSITLTVASTRPISLHALVYDAKRGDVTDWPSERFEIYAEVAGIQ